MKFKTATKPLAAHYAKLCDARDVASDEIFAAAQPCRDVPWATCFRDYANQTARNRYLDADRAIQDFQIKMRNQKRGYFENGRFSWY